MRATFAAIAVIIRPRQWLKNLALILPALFSGHIFSSQVWEKLGVGIIVFCLLSASNYIVNDILDATVDRKHPYKKFRPLARKQLPEDLAWFVAFVFLILGLLLSFILPQPFALISFSYVLLHYLSYFLLRYHSVVDVVSIALGYVLRIWAGEAAGGYHISVWLFLAVLSLSLLLAIGKRRAELTLFTLHHKLISPESPRHFPYSEKLLDAYVAVFANATFLTYAYFTFLASPVFEGVLLKGNNDVFLGRKWLMLTLPFVIYGIMRYLQLVYEKQTRPLDQVLTSDRPLVVTGALWLVTVLLAVYGIGR